MFEQIFRECKTAVRSVTYVIFCIALIAVFLFQYRVEVNDYVAQAKEGILYQETRWGGTQNNLLVKPTPEMGDYGAADAEVPEQVQRNMAYRFYRDIASNRYDTYRLGVFLTHKNLKVEKLHKIQTIFKTITGETFYDIDADFYLMDLKKVMADQNFTQRQAIDYLKHNYYKQLKYEFDPNYETTRFFDYEKYIPVRQDLTYDEFKTQIGKLRKIIGGRSDVYLDFAQYGSVPLTYEEALAQYETFVDKDRISGAFARLFCDKLGVVAGILPVLIAWAIAVGGVLRKTRGKPYSSLHSAGAENTWIRFFSISAMAFLPILLLAIAATAELAAGVRPLGLTIDYFAFIGYSFAWLLPTIMFTTAVGLFFVALTKGSAGIYVQLVIWYGSLWMIGENGLEPIKYGVNMFLRHSVIGGYDTYIDSLGGIAVNRIAYTAAALVLIAGAKYLTELRGRGPGNGISARSIRG